MLARAFVIIGGFVVLALIAALIAPLFIDWTSYRADFERQASAILGRPVTVAGRASARLIPFPSVTFTDVRVGGEGGEPAMTAAAFSMDAELAPFLSGNILIFDMRIDRPRVAVTVAPDGRLDWAMRPATSIDPAKIALENVTIVDGEIVLRHGPGGRTHIFGDLDARLSAKSLLGPIRVEGNGRFDAMETAFSLATGKPDNGAMRVLFRLQPEFAGFALETDGAVRLDDGRPAYGGVFMLDQMAATPLRDGAGGTVAGPLARVPDGWRARGKFTADPQRIDAPEVRLETGPVAEPYVAEGKATIDLGAAARFALSLDGRQVTLDDAGVDGAQPLTDRLATLAEMLADAPKPPIPGVVSARIPAIVAGDTTLRDVVFEGEAADDGWSIGTLSAQLPGRTTLEASGFLAGGQSPSFSGDLLIAIGQPSGFAAWLGQDVDEAIRRLPGAGISAKASFNRHRQALDDMEIRLGAAAFRGRATRESPDGSEPSLAVDVDGGALDLQALQTLGAIILGKGGGDRFAGAAFDVKLVAGPVDAGGGLVAEKIDAALRLRGGGLDVDRLLIDGIEGAHVSATARLDGFPQVTAGSVDASLTGPDLAPLVSRLADRFPSVPGLSWLDARAAAWPGLLGEARIDLVATLAEDDGARRHAISAHGNAGGTNFTLSAAGALNGDGVMGDRKATLAFDGENADAGALMALSGLPALPIGQAPAGRLVVDLSGKPEEGQTAKYALESGADALRFTGFHDADGRWTGEATLRADDAGPWLMTAGMAVPGLAEGFAVDLKSSVAFAGGRIALPTLTGRISGEEVSGDLVWTMKNGKPEGSGKLAVGAIDLPYALRAVFGDGAIGDTGVEWSGQAFAAAPTLPFTGVFDLAVQRVDTGWGPPVSVASMRLTIRNEGASANDIRGELAGGHFSGFGEVRNIGGEGALAFNGAVEAVDLAALARLDGVSGKADATVALTGGGRTAEALASSLAGSGALVFEHLGLAGVDAWALDAVVEQADGAGATITSEAAEAIVRKLALNGATTFGPLETAVSISGGEARAENMRFAHAAADLDADARFDIAALSAGAAATFVYSAGDHAVIGAEPAIGFAVDGPVDALAVAVDPQPFGRFLLQRALEKEQARIEALQAALAEKQRLRRETRYFAWLADERARAAAEEAARLKAEEEARRAAEAETLKKIADEAAALTKASEDAAAKAQAEADATAKAQAEADAAAKAQADAAAKAKTDTPVSDPQPKKPAKTLAAPAAEVFPEPPKPKSKIGGLFDFFKPKAPASSAE